MPDQILVRTECGVDVLENQAIVLSLCTTHHVRDELLSPATFGPLAKSGEGARLSGALPLDVAIGLFEKLGKAIQELLRRQTGGR
jgi:hypothetical protein